MLKSRIIALSAACAGALALATNANASVSYSTTASTYTQNFDSLPVTPVNTSLGSSPTGWTDDNASPGAGNFSILGWYLYHPVTQAEGGFNGNQRFRTGTGSVTTGSFYSYSNSSSSTERALGMVPSSTTAGNGDSMRIGLRLTNNTGVALNTFTITYDGEEYRDDAATDAISFSYALDSDISAIPGATWHDAGAAANFVNAATFNPPVETNSPAAAINGNTTGLVAGITATVNLATPWQPGTDLWLRWSQVQIASLSDDGLAIDNVNFSADVPEPAALGLLGIASLGLFRRRRA